MPLRKDGVDDPYIDHNGVLLNKLNITDARILQETETALSVARSAQLYNDPIQGQYDFNHLKAIHHHLFQDVYTWAGQPRTVDISKNDSLFAKHHFIESEGAKIFDALSQEHQEFQNYNRDVFCDRTAYHLSEVNALHPFREGNGRTQRELFTQLARESGYDLDWSRVTQQQMIQASQEAFFKDHHAMAALISRSIDAERVYQEDQKQYDDSYMNLDENNQLSEKSYYNQDAEYTKAIEQVSEKNTPDRDTGGYSSDIHSGYDEQE